MKDNILKWKSEHGMDILFQAALRGDVEELHELLAKSPLILYQVSFLSAQNPLHFASAAGHLDFARKILELKPEFARQLNEDGYSPIHFASANGHIDIVREIIKVDSNICRLEGGDGRTPLHLTVLGGRIDVISEMLATCEGCLKDLTMQKETALHLAVRNFQLASLRVLLDWSKHKNKEILNMKDEHGNTILHLAIWKKQRQARKESSNGPNKLKQVVIQVVELLLRNYSGILEVNAVNKSGLTALDLLLIFPSEAGDREIQEILQGAGASKAQNLIPNSTTCNSTTNLDPPSNNCRAKGLIDFFRFHDGRDSPSDVRSTLLVIAVLVATATYQVGISPPGDVWQEDDEGHVAGTSIMATHNLVSYILLVSSNSIGFNVSLYMICTLTSKFPLQTELQVCIFALYMTFITAVTATSPKSTRLFTNVFTSALPTVVPLSCFLLRKYRVIQRFSQRGCRGIAGIASKKSPYPLSSPFHECSKSFTFCFCSWALGFCKENTGLKPEFARQLNEDGYSPIHLASANGHADIVREIIKVDSNICRLEGGDGRTPLHLAVLGGKVDVISEMLAACEGCLEDLTMQKETALHLAVRHYQLASLRVLLDWSKQIRKEEILNMKDEHGNTILHLAVWKKQRQASHIIYN
ncbi:Ankyrin repeat-containing protein BDA1 [Bienertia sinuspersici]